MGDSGSLCVSRGVAGVILGVILWNLQVPGRPPPAGLEQGSMVRWVFLTWTPFCSSEMSPAFSCCPLPGKWRQGSRAPLIQSSSDKACVVEGKALGAPQARLSSPWQEAARVPCPCGLGQTPPFMLWPSASFIGHDDNTYQ